MHRVGLASRTGLPSAVRLGLGAARWPGRPKERKGEEENEKWVAQVFCVTGGGLGVPGPSPGDFSSLEGSSETPGFGRWLQFRFGKVGDQESRHAT